MKNLKKKQRPTKTLVAKKFAPQKANPDSVPIKAHAIQYYYSSM